METTEKNRDHFIRPGRRIDYLFCFGIACLAVALLCSPLFIWKTGHVHKVWNQRAEAVKKDIVARSPQERFLKEALIESVGQLGKASVRAMKSTAMEIEMTLTVAGFLLLWFRMREKKLQKERGTGLGSLP